MTEKWGTYDAKRVRVTVKSWDDNFITTTDYSYKICFSNDNKYLTRGGKGDWSYLSKILSEGCQLNLVRVRLRDDICYPELIIYEPDYLINITAVASCFETYAESPYVNLINKIKPQANSIPIHLGNLAGEFLDNTVNHRHDTFEETFQRFLMRNALGMIACKEMANRQAFQDFLDNARQQLQNIEELIGKGLPNIIDHYDSKNVTLEPSFISELLGIQGRMDFLHEGTDGNTLIIEQKSGKGAFPPSQNPDIPLPQEKHVVQLLLYRALYVYGFDKYSDQLQHFMLLYSKYKEGLIDISQEPGLFIRTFRMRNLLAWCELTYAQQGMGLLRTITPEILNRKGISGSLWENFVRRQLQDLLMPIGTASQLEQDYYLRFLRFISMEQKLAKLGNGTIDNPGFASIWNSTLQEKQEAGNIIIADGDTIISGASSNFRVGDIVIVYPCQPDGTPDACAQMINRTSIAELSATKVKLMKSDSEMVMGKEKRLTAIEHDLFDSSSGALYSGMHAFLSAPKERRDLLLCQRAPRIDHNIKINGEYGAFNNLVTKAKQARDYFLVIGPPGTGKTSHGLVNILKEELLSTPSGHEETCILLLSYTNRAVDEICSKLEEQQLDYIRIGSELSCSPEYRPHLLTKRTHLCSSGNEIAKMLRSTRIVCGTTSAINSNISLLSIKHFSLAIIDEASQILEPHLTGILSARYGEGSSIDRFVMIGDHKQLPAVVQQSSEDSAVTEENLRNIGLTNCRRSLFERLLTNGRATEKASEEQENATSYLLSKQGRMHTDIAEFPNIAFYGGKLDIVPLPHQQKKTDDSYRVEFHIVHPSDADDASETDKVNTAEAQKIAEKVREIYEITKESFDVNQTIGVIVPYRNQITAVRNAIDSYGIPMLHDISIDTVERYQGSQRDYILYGFTVRKPYQLTFLSGETFEEDGKLIDRKLNVAMTRARLQLHLYGNPAILNQSPVFRDLIDFLKSKGKVQ